MVDQPPAAKSRSRTWPTTWSARRRNSKWAGAYEGKDKVLEYFAIRDGKTTEVWGMAENDAAVDPFLDRLPG